MTPIHFVRGKLADGMKYHRVSSDITRRARSARIASRGKVR